MLNVLGFGACIAMLGYALYAQHFLGLEPCPLCMFQRVGVAVLGCAFLVAALHRPKSVLGARVNAALVGFAALLPVGVAARHVYVQSQPPGSVPSCGATLDYMLEVFPLLDVVKRVLTGGGECATIDWAFLGLSMPAWVLAVSLALGAVGVIANSADLPSRGPRFAL